jgi:putative transposase
MGDARRTGSCIVKKPHTAPGSTFRSALGGRIEWGGTAMRTSRFSDQEIAMILRQADDGSSIREICERVGISQQTYYRWRRLYLPDEPTLHSDKRIRQLEEENRRLKEMVVDLSLEKSTLQDVLHKKA